MGVGARKVAAKAVSPHREYEPYLEAKWGLKNHWYPAAFTHEVPDKLVKGVMIAGHEIALRRGKGGKVYALADRCAHRGVRISKKSMCLTDEHLTCWYHGFTYGLEDGVLKTILASPDDAQIGKTRIRTYPTHEKNGMIWVFVGDEDFKPVPPLTSDLPMRVPKEYDPNPVAFILDDNTFVRGIHRTGDSNWRLAVENGFDPGHVLIHYDNVFIAATDRKLALGWQPKSPEAVEVIDLPEGPKGIMNRYDPHLNLYNYINENAVTGMKVYGKQEYYVRTSMWVPGVLLVEHWPVTNWAQYEFYVPIDDTHHEYWEIIVGHCNSEEDRKEAEFKYTNFFEPLGLLEFNNRDLFAREAMQDFYEKMDGWNQEQLCKLDAVVVGWRKLAARFNRGIQAPPPGADRKD
ncbi:MAG: Rieske 2Fe-2S domain-containing protein [Candidatus Binataceae bacterium]|nr:Rieske 2Fe-2S domain-containing protein [Candidatus Binataceae bacterium]